VIKSASDRAFGLESDYLWHKARLKVESNFNPNAQSPVGALGLAQFMPATALDYGAKTTAQRLDPSWSINAMVRYIRDIWGLLERNAKMKIQAKDHQMLSDASYNTGQGRVLKLCRRECFTWESIVESLPQETRNYSPKIQSWRDRYMRGLQ
jgi:membrane-bound lytic murein transglycosylase F